jgi:hypothetical protein
MTNIVQKVRLAFSVRQGTLNQHREFGLPIEVGSSVADISAVDLARASQGMFNGDPTFVGVAAAKVDMLGPVTRLGIAVEIAGTSQVIPVSVDVRQ